MRKHLAIVPAYNEGASVARVVAELHEEASSFDVLVVDDGSTDETAAHARTAGALVLQHPFNLGIGGAMQSGYCFAAENGYDLACQVDGDGQHDPAQIVHLLEHLRTHPELHMVTGSPLLRPPPDRPRPPLSRRTG